jgi:hypothetical protein
MNVAIEGAASECSHSLGASNTRNRPGGALKKLFRRSGASKKKQKSTPSPRDIERDTTLAADQDSSCRTNHIVESVNDEKSSSTSSSKGSSSRRTKIFKPLSTSCSGALDASKLLMGLKSSDVDKIVSCIDYVGSNVLHLACYKGASFEAISHLLSTCSQTHRKMLVNTRDKDGRVPIQIAAECICRDKIDLEEGMKIVQVLHEADPFVIHNSDENMHSAIDVVFLSLVNIHSQSEEYKRLAKLYSHLRSLSVEAYKEKKKLWEQNGSTCRNKSDDNRTQYTESTGADYSSCPSEMSAVG